MAVALCYGPQYISAMFYHARDNCAPQKGPCRLAASWVALSSSKREGHKSGCSLIHASHRRSEEIWDLLKCFI